MSGGTPRRGGPPDTRSAYYLYIYIHRITINQALSELGVLPIVLVAASAGLIICIYVYMLHTYIHTYIEQTIYIYIYMYVYMYMHIYIYIYTYIHVYIYSRRARPGMRWNTYDLL